MAKAVLVREHRRGEESIIVFIELHTGRKTEERGMPKTSLYT